VDDFLPVWAQPHRFALLEQRQRAVFTFGLALREVRVLRSVKGVRAFARRWGYEWLAGLSAGVQKETRRPLPTSELETFLREEHGIAGPNELDGNVIADLDYDRLREPSDALLRSFAETHGALIREWSRKAFTMVDVNLRVWAEARERVAEGKAAAARRRLILTQMPHLLTSVRAIDGASRWARQYSSLYERVALELEDLVLRRPKPRICPLCNEVFIALRPAQSICGNQVWDALSGQLVRRCTPGTETAVYGAAEAAEYRKRRKTQWARMDRALKTYGPDDRRTKRAVKEFDSWRRENPPPRPPGRPRTATPESEEAPYLPVD
jgi:hypothetical protein